MDYQLGIWYRLFDVGYEGRQVGVVRTVDARLSADLLQTDIVPLLDGQRTSYGQTALLYLYAVQTDFTIGVVGRVVQHVDVVSLQRASTDKHVTDD